MTAILDPRRHYQTIVCDARYASYEYHGGQPRAVFGDPLFLPSVITQNRPVKIV
jgi:hypothetical protein